MGPRDAVLDEGRYLLVQSEEVLVLRCGGRSGVE